jgi:hypothetical protein
MKLDISLSLSLEWLLTNTLVASCEEGLYQASKSETHTFHETFSFLATVVSIIRAKNKYRQAGRCVQSKETGQQQRKNDDVTTWDQPSKKETKGE